MAPANDLKLKWESRFVQDDEVHVSANSRAEAFGEVHLLFDREPSAGVKEDSKVEVAVRPGRSGHLGTEGVDRCRMVGQEKPDYDPRLICR